MNIKRLGSLMLILVLLVGHTAGCGTQSGHSNVQNSKEIGSIPEGGDEIPEADEKAAIKNGDDEKKQDTGLLKGRTICIDPGHQLKGNNDKEAVAPGSKVLKPKTTSGTAGVVTGIPEYSLNLQVSLLLRDRLKEYGARVVMTRETDKVDISNIERAGIANAANADLAVRIHADGAADSSVRGASVLYPGAKYIADSDLLARSKNAAIKVSEAISKFSDPVSVKTVERNDLTGFNWSTVPVILVEMGFMSNPEEDRRMKTKEFREKMAEAIAKGIIEYFVQIL